MVKTLINKIKKGIKKAVLVGAAAASIGIGATACQPPGTTPYENRAPVITSAPSNGYINEGNQYFFDVNATDADGDSLEYSLTDNYGWLNMNPVTGEITGTAPSVDTHTEYPIQVNVSDGKATTSHNCALTVNDTTVIPTEKNISGFLRDNETNSNQPGEVRAYIDTNHDGVADTTLSDSDGYDFSFNVPEGSNVRLEGALGSSGNWQSYKVTEELGDITEDKTGVLVKAVPYDNPSDVYDNGLLNDSTKIANFKEFAGRANFWSADERIAKDFLNGMLLPDYINGNPEHGLKKWNRGEISDTNAHPVLKGYKVSTLLDSVIKNRLESTGLIVEYNEENPAVYVPGWITVLPSPDDVGAGTVPYDLTGDGHIEFATVYLNTTDEAVGFHETMWHANMGSVGHSSGIRADGSEVSELSDLPSMGRDVSPYPQATGFTPADEKLSRIIKSYPGMKTLDSILGENWQN